VLVALVPTATAPQPMPTPSEPPCRPLKSLLGSSVKQQSQIHLLYACAFEFVPNASSDPNELVIRWQTYGIKSLELHIHPSSSGCGIGTRRLRQPMPFKLRSTVALAYRGCYKIGPFANAARWARARTGASYTSAASDYFLASICATTVLRSLSPRPLRFTSRIASRG
jgi:hypothetical protein